MKKTHRHFDYQKRKAWVGFAFVSVWLFGFIVFFLSPLVNSAIYSMSDLEITPQGLEMKFIGTENYQRAFLQDSEFVPALLGSLRNLLLQMPIIIVFSLLLALLLNQKFYGRTLVRAIFFLPVIVASGIIIRIIQSDTFAEMVMSGERASMMFQAATLMEILETARIRDDIAETIFQTVNDFFALSWRSGIQMLIFLAGLQSVPSSLYEASAMEGANSWESFWRITFPMISPLILTNVVYTIVDLASDFSNPTMVIISQVAGRLNIEYAAALSWINSFFIFVILGIFYLIINRRIFYMTD